MNNNREETIKHWAYQKYLKRIRDGIAGTAEKDWEEACEEYAERSEEEKWTRG